MVMVFSHFDVWVCVVMPKFLHARILGLDLVTLFCASKMKYTEGVFGLVVLLLIN